MILAGFQKLSLIDFPGVIAAVVFTQGCAFRCAYCHNPELTSFDVPAGVSVDEVLEYLKARRSLIEGVCVTGGEPTLQKDLQDFLFQIKRLGLLVKLDTTGINAERIKGILEKKLVDYIAMDIKHVWGKYGEVVGPVNETALTNCQRSFKLIQSSGVAHEFRTTILPGVHSVDDFKDMIGYLNPGELYVIQQTRFTKTLRENIEQEYGFKPDELVEMLKKCYPDRVINLR